MSQSELEFPLEVEELDSEVEKEEVEENDEEENDVLVDDALDAMLVNDDEDPIKVAVAKLIFEVSDDEPFELLELCPPITETYAKYPSPATSKTTTTIAISRDLAIP